MRQRVGLRVGRVHTHCFAFLSAEAAEGCNGGAVTCLPCLRFPACLQQGYGR